MGLEDGAEDLEEEGGGAARGGDDGELAAPVGDGFGEGVEEALVRVEGKFVEGDVAAFTGEGVGVGGEGVDAAAIGEFEDVGGGTGIGFEEDFAEVGGADVEEIGPVAAIIELKAGLAKVAGGDKGVEAGVFGADEADEAEAVGVGETGLAGLDADFEWGIVIDP